MPDKALYCRGDVVQVDTWVCASGKNGMRRDWLVRDCKTGETLTRASRYMFPQFSWQQLFASQKKEREKTDLYNYSNNWDYSYFPSNDSVWVMMNKQTRKLSKIPGEVRGEIEPYFANSPPIVEEDGRKLPKLDDDSADYIRTGLTVSYNTSLG